ncbi:hypothetical protein BJX66DRAFT_312897 [Aspergillus keveii]|uniref:Uncharacterized protein n=1 Tax=Aspergillus keveii TaxID=714993 RepID=A0ABR4FSZ0_9EURO
MTTNSGAKGECQECNHWNNVHKSRVCRAPGCRVMWKRCQAPGGCTEEEFYKICKSCSDHPGAEPEW